MQRCPQKRLKGSGPFKQLLLCDERLKDSGHGPDLVLFCSACNVTWTTDSKDMDHDRL